MTPTQTAVIVAAGLLGGALNTMAAGGGVLTFLALILTGVPPQVAIATSQMAIPASFLAGVPRAWRSRADYRPIAVAIIAAGIGTGLGVWLVTLLDADTFRQITPLLMVTAATLLLLHPHMPRLIGERHAATTARGRQTAVAVALFGASLYAGAFGGGVAVAILLVFACLTPWPWHQSNATKNVVCLIMSVIGSAAFAATGARPVGPGRVAGRIAAARRHRGHLAGHPTTGRHAAQRRRGHDRVRRRPDDQPLNPERSLTMPDNLDRSDGFSPVDGEAHWRRLLANLAGEPPSTPAVRGWVTWTQAVQAGCYSDLDALDALHAWAQQLHEQGRLTTAVRFSLEDDGATPVGVLFDPDETLARWVVLRPGSYLVFTGTKLVVLDEKSFHATYCDPAYAYSQTPADHRRAG